MNERIKKLGEQANWYKPRGLPSDWDEEDYIVSPEDMKKFAELIVRECIAVHEDDYGVDIIGDVLKKHFGVEE